MTGSGSHALLANTALSEDVDSTARTISQDDAINPLLSYSAAEEDRRLIAVNTTRTLDTLPNEVLFAIHRALPVERVTSNRIWWSTHTQSIKLLTSAVRSKLGQTSSHMRDVCAEAHFTDEAFDLSVDLKKDVYGKPSLVRELQASPFLNATLGTGSKDNIRLLHLKIIILPAKSPWSDEGGEYGIIYHIDCNPKTSIVTIKWSDIDAASFLQQWFATKDIYHTLKSFLATDACGDGMSLYCGFKLVDVKTIIDMLYSTYYEVLRDTVDTNRAEFHKFRRQVRLQQANHQEKDYDSDGAVICNHSDIFNQDTQWETGEIQQPTRDEWDQWMAEHYNDSHTSNNGQMTDGVATGYSGGFDDHMASLDITWESDLAGYESNTDTSEFMDNEEEQDRYWHVPAAQPPADITLEKALPVEILFKIAGLVFAADVGRSMSYDAGGTPLDTLHKAQECSLSQVCKTFDQLLHKPYFENRSFYFEFKVYGVAARADLDEFIQSAERNVYLQHHLGPDTEVRLRHLTILVRPSYMLEEDEVLYHIDCDTTKKYVRVRRENVPPLSYNMKLRSSWFLARPTHTWLKKRLNSDKAVDGLEHWHGLKWVDIKKLLNDLFDKTFAGHLDNLLSVDQSNEVIKQGVKYRRRRDKILQYTEWGYESDLSDQPRDELWNLEEDSDDDLGPGFPYSDW